MEELQNPDFIRHYLQTMQEFAGLTQEKAMAVFGQYEAFMSANYGFYNTFVHAGYWGILGSLFVILLFVKNPFARSQHAK